MDTITLTLAMTIIIALVAASWKILSKIHDVEVQVSNHLKHDIQRIEEKVDVIKDKVYELETKVVSCGGCKKD